jgi:uncharacterized membrane protein
VESVEIQGIIFVMSEDIDFTGGAIIALGALLGVIRCAQDLLRKERAGDAYSRLRTFLGHSLLLGLEFLVAGDGSDRADARQRGRPGHHRPGAHGAES